jgi:hypothetical protein
MHDVVHVVPQVVVLSNMSCEPAFRLLVKGKPFEVANEALVVFILLHEILLFS